jgi:serine/threonine protein kinase
MKACTQCHTRFPADIKYCFKDGAELAPINDPRIGTTVAGRYVIEDVIGEGGMATVYRARHKLIERPCAIKIMTEQWAADATTRERFRREAKNAQVLAHPNIIEIYDHGEDGGIPYMVMELLDGRAIADMLRNQEPVSVERAVPLLIQIARGIARAHDLGVVHRDLKPENIFVCRRPLPPDANGTPQPGATADLVKLLDFGIARSRADSRLTNSGELFGTPQYMAPERVMSGESGPSVDLYALGVIFYEILTGKLPLEASDATTFLVKHMKEVPRPPRALNPRIPKRLDALVVSLLQKDPRARPVDAHRVEHDLVEIARELRIKLPPEPDKDDTSSRRPARSLPAIVVEQWVRRSDLFEQMLARAYGRSPPPDVTRTLAEITKRVREISEARASSVKEQHVLEEVDQRGREGRQRFGFAVDALGSDASKAKEEARSARIAFEALSEKTAAAAQAFAETQREVVTWEGRTALYEPHMQLAMAYRRAADAVDVWLEERTHERAAQTIVEDKDRVVSDLEYQIAELRSALANHEQGVEREREEAMRRVLELNTLADRIEAQLLHLATRFCAPMRTRPELGGLFQELEAEVM